MEIIAVTVLVIAGLGVSVAIHGRNQAGFRERDALSRQQDKQLADLTAENQRLSNLVARAASASAQDPSAELAKLRAQAEALRKQTNELAKLSPPRQQPHSSRAAASPTTHPPEYWDQLHQIMGARGTDARNLATAVSEYAAQHQGHAPHSLDELDPYLGKAGRPLSGTNQFEIVFQGSLDQLQGLPPGEVAVVREQQTWLTPDGKTARVYGLNGGIGQVVASDDNFQTWESKHIIPPLNAGKSAR